MSVILFESISDLPLEQAREFSERLQLASGEQVIVVIETTFDHLKDTLIPDDAQKIRRGVLDYCDRIILEGSLHE